MPNPSAAPTLAATRYRVLVDQLADEAGRPARGWQSEVARRLGVDRSYISKLLDPETDFAVGVEAIERSCERLGLKRTFFTARSPYRRPSYTGYVERDRTRIVSRSDGPILQWADLPVVASKVGRAIDRGRAGSAELHALALDVIATPAVQLALRVVEMRPHRHANERRIREVGRELVAALCEDKGAATAADEVARGYRRPNRGRRPSRPRRVYGAVA